MRKFLLWAGFLSAATSVSAQNRAGDYKTVASGNWNNVAIWQKYNGTTWQPATTSPVAADKTISITSPFNVIYNVTDPVDELVINAGGILTLESSSFNLQNGPGSDLTVLGTLEWNKGWTGNCTQWEIQNGGKVNANFKGQGSNCGTWNIKPGGTLSFIDVDGHISGTTINNEGTLNFAPNAPNKRLRSNVAGTQFAGRINNKPDGMIVVKNFPFSIGTNRDNIYIINEGSFSFLDSLHIRTAHSFVNQGRLDSPDNLGRLVIHNRIDINQGTSFGLFMGFHILGYWSTNTPIIIGQANGIHVENGRIGGASPLGINGGLILTGDVTLGDLDSTVRSTVSVDYFWGSAELSNLKSLNIINGGFSSSKRLTVYMNYVPSKSININKGYFTASDFQVQGAGDIRFTTSADSSGFNLAAAYLYNGATLDFSQLSGQNSLRLYALEGVGEVKLSASLQTFSNRIVPGSKLVINAPGNPLSQSTGFRARFPGWSNGSAYLPPQMLRSGNLQLQGDFMVENDYDVPEGEYEVIKLTNGSIAGQFARTFMPAEYSLIYKPDAVVLKRKGPMAFATQKSGTWPDLSLWKIYNGAGGFSVANRIPEGTDKYANIYHPLEVTSNIVVPSFTMYDSGSIDISAGDFTLGGTANRVTKTMTLRNAGAVKTLNNTIQRSLAVENLLSWTGGQIHTSLLNYQRTDVSGATYKGFWGMILNDGRLNLFNTTLQARGSAFIKNQKQITLYNSSITGANNISTIQNAAGSTLTVVGTTSIPGFDNNNGLVNGVGSLTAYSIARLENVDPGYVDSNSVSHSGKLSITSTVAYTGVFNLKIDVPSAGAAATHDQLAFGNSLDLSKITLTVNVGATGGFAPDTIISATSGSITGDFAAATIPAGFTLRKGTNFVVLERTTARIAAFESKDGLINADRPLFVPTILRRTQVFKIQGLQANAESVTMLNANGQQVFAESNYGNNKSLAKLGPGLYFYRITTRKGKIYSGKIVVTD